MITENETAHGATSARAENEREQAERLRARRLADPRSLGDIIAETQTDISNIVHKEIQLAKTELKVDAQKTGKSVGMFGAAAVFAVFALNLLLFALAFLLDHWLPRSASFAIVAVLLLAVAAALALIGKKTLATVDAKPERTIRNAQETVDADKLAAKQG